MQNLLQYSFLKKNLNWLSSVKELSKKLIIQNIFYFLNIFILLEIISISNIIIQYIWNNDVIDYFNLSQYQGRSQTTTLTFYEAWTELRLMVQ